MLLLKNRYGRPNLELPLWFNGECNHFVELHEAKTQEIQQLYETLKRIDRK